MGPRLPRNKCFGQTFINPESSVEYTLVLVHDRNKGIIKKEYTETSIFFVGGLILATILFGLGLGTSEIVGLDNDLYAVVNFYKVQ